MNIISLVSANAGIQGIYMNEQYKRHSRVYTWELERHTGGPGRMELQKVGWRSTLPLRYSDQQRRNPYAPIPGHKKPGESVKLPGEYDAKPGGEPG